MERILRDPRPAVIGPSVHDDRPPVGRGYRAGDRRQRDDGPSEDVAANPVRLPLAWRAAARRSRRRNGSRNRRWCRLECAPELASSACAASWPSSSCWAPPVSPTRASSRTASRSRHCRRRTPRSPARRRRWPATSWRPREDCAARSRVGTRPPRSPRTSRTSRCTISGSCAGWPNAGGSATRCWPRFPATSWARPVTPSSRGGHRRDPARARAARARGRRGAGGRAALGVRRGGAALWRALVGAGGGQLRRVGVRARAQRERGRRARADAVPPVDLEGLRPRRRHRRPARRDPRRGPLPHARGRAANVDRALFAYNHSSAYVRAVRRFAARMRADERTFLTYYAWQVYVRTPSGSRRITGPGV